MADSTILLRPGMHKQLLLKVVEEFGPRFAPGAKLLFVGAKSSKHVVFDAGELAKLNVPVTVHNQLADIILHSPVSNYLFLIEAATSHGPVTLKRHHEIEVMLKNCPAGRVYVTAFRDMNAFRKCDGMIPWGTHAWIAQTPDHMIHFNSSKLIEPYKHAE